MGYYEPTLNETSFFNQVLNLYITHKNVIESKCGKPTKNGNCKNICFDLDFNVISC